MPLLPAHAPSLRQVPGGGAGPDAQSGTVPRIPPRLRWRTPQARGNHPSRRALRQVPPPRQRPRVLGRSLLQLRARGLHAGLHTRLRRPLNMIGMSHAHPARRDPAPARETNLTQRRRRPAPAGRRPAPPSRSAVGPSAAGEISVVAFRSSRRALTPPVERSCRDRISRPRIPRPQAAWLVPSQES
jgi:hypothetical protein